MYDIGTLPSLMKREKVFVATDKRFLPQFLVIPGLDVIMETRKHVLLSNTDSP